MKTLLTAAVLLTLLVSPVSAYTGPWLVQVHIVQATDTVLISNTTPETIGEWEGTNHIVPMLYNPQGDVAVTNLFVGELLIPYQVHKITVRTWLGPEPYGTLVVFSEYPVTVRVVEACRITRR